MTTTTFEQISDNFIYWPELSHPHLSKIDFGASPVSELIPIFQKQLKQDAQPISPYIFEFYGYNSLIRDMCKKHHDIVPKEYLELYLGYQQLLNQLGEKIFTYILVSSMTESSYCLNLQPIFEHIQRYTGATSLFDSDIDYVDYIKSMNTASGKKIIKNISKKLLSAKTLSTISEEEVIHFIQEIGFNYCNLYSQTDAERSEEFLSGISLLRFKNIPIKSLLNVLEDIFSNGQFDINYGGNKWKDIVNHLYQFTIGNINSEIFVDQAFSLEHNNGSLFSKHFIFETSEKYNILIQPNANGNTIPFNKKFINFNQLLLNSQNHSTVFQVIQMNIQDLLSNTLKSSNSYDNLEQFLNFQQFIKKSCSNFIDKFQDLFKDPLPINLAEMVNFDTDVQSILEENLKELISHKNKKNKFNFNIYDSKSILNRQIDKNIVGNKAWGISQLHGLGIPTPPALVLDIPTCLSFLQFPKKFEKSLHKNHKIIYKVMGYLENPKMVSIRSGSNISMPGMMDTILNVGIDDDTYPKLCLKYSTKVVDECAIKFMQQFSKNLSDDYLDFSVLKPIQENLYTFKKLLEKHHVLHTGKIFPLKRDEQVKYCIEQVFSSWNSDRSKAWRKENKIHNSFGTACTIQEMVLGNFNNNSMTGVVFSRDCILGTDKIIGEYLCNAQGEDVVSGSHTPHSIENMKTQFPHIYNQLKVIAQTLEDEYKTIQDIEFTVENGKLYILQHRKAIASPIANAQLLNNHYKLLSEVDMSVLKNSLDVQTTQCADITGKCAQDGILHGIVIQSEEDKQKFAHIFQENSFRGNFGWILSTKNSSPEHTPLLLKSDAFITQQGGYTCHAAIIARSLKKPCIVGTGVHNLIPGDVITMNAYSGEIWKGIIPISYDNSQSLSIARNIIKLSNFTEESISFNQQKMTETSSWNAQFSHRNIIENYQLKDNLSDIQKAAIMIVQNKRNSKF